VDDLERPYMYIALYHNSQLVTMNVRHVSARLHDTNFGWGGGVMSGGVCSPFPFSFLLLSMRPATCHASRKSFGSQSLCTAALLLLMHWFWVS